MSPAFSMSPLADLTGPGMRRHSSGVSSGRCVSWMVRDTWASKALVRRPLVVTCSFATVVWPVSLDRCSAVSRRFGG